MPRFTRSVLASAVTLAVSAGTATAQEEQQLDNIVVSASGFEQAMVARSFRAKGLPVLPMPCATLREWMSAAQWAKPVVATLVSVACPATTR